MSSKEQFKGALKREKQIIAYLNGQIQAKDSIIKDLKFQLKQQNNKTIQTYKPIKKKWWQFWK